MRKVDGLAKATGRARYTDDIRLPGMLHGKILRSPHPHARIEAIDTSRAEALEGVHAIVTGRDMPTTFGIIPWTPDEYPLCVDKVRYVGDGVAAVAAVDEDTAIAALDLIDVTYEELPAYLDPHEAIAAEAGPYIHEPRKPGWNGNVTKVVKLEFGEVEDGFAEADLVVEGDYLFEGTTHTPIEPHCAIGLAEGERQTHRVVGDPGPPLPAPRAGPGAGGRSGEGAGHPAPGRRCLRRQVRALRPGVLRREAVDEDGPPGQDPLHPGRGLLRPPWAATPSTCATAPAPPAKASSPRSTPRSSWTAGRTRPSGSSPPTTPDSC